MRRLLTMPLAIFVILAVDTLFPGVTGAGTLRIGSIGARPAEEFRKFAPLARYLAAQLQSEGIEKDEVVVAKSVSEMANLLREGKVDLYIDSPFPVLAVRHLAGTKLLLRRWKKGVSEYHTVFFTMVDSGIDRLKDLRGKMIGFDDSYSTTGYFVPKVVLLQAGLKVTPKNDASDLVAPSEVGYVFSGDDENLMVWVLRKKVAAGAMDNQGYENLARGRLDSLKIIYRTFSLPRQIVSCRTDLPVPMVGRIKSLLLKMDQSEEGRRSLQDFEETARFDEIPEGALAALLNAKKFLDAEFGLK